MYTASRCLLTALRLVLPVWVGAAVLFAINAVAEQRHPFDSVTKNQLALLRFPDYYRFGFACIASALVITGVLMLFKTNHRRQLVAAMAVLLLVVSLMLWDFFFVYRPLHDMIIDPAQPKPSSWVRLHATSMIINLIHVALCLVAAVIVCWPRQEARGAEESLKGRAVT